MSAFKFYEHPASTQTPNPYAPEFNQQVIDSVNPPGYNINCYEYAVSGTRAPEPDHVNPGKTQDLIWWLEKSDHNIESLTEKVLADGLIKDSSEFTHKNGVPFKEHYYAVALLIRENKDYHFMRQNRDGSWSEVGGLNQPAVYVCDKSGNPIINNPHEIEYGHYKFSGYFLVPEGGIDVGSDVKLDRLAEHGATAKQLAQVLRRVIDLHYLLPETPSKEHIAEQFRTMFNLPTTPDLAGMLKVAEEHQLKPWPGTKADALVDMLGFNPQIKLIVDEVANAKKAQSQDCAKYDEYIRSMDNHNVADELKPLFEQISIETIGKKPDGTLPVYLYNPNKSGVVKES